MVSLDTQFKPHGYPTQSVKASFNYWASEDEPECSRVLDIINGQHPNQAIYETEVQDIRPNLAQFALDSHGFQVFKHDSVFLSPILQDKSGAIDFQDMSQVKQHYWPEVCELMTSLLGARSVIGFNSTTRVSLEGPHLKRQTPAPFFTVHNDQSAPGARALLRNMKSTFFEDLGTLAQVKLEERENFFRLRDEIIATEDKNIIESGASDFETWDGANYTGPRWGTFSIWRPLETVESDPLAVLDPNTMFTDADFGACNSKDTAKSFKLTPLSVENRPGFNPFFWSSNILPLFPRNGKKHSWYYVEKQRPDEILALKLFDSEAWRKGRPVIQGAGHSAFALPNSEKRAPRRSVEVRLLVIW